MCGLLPPNRRTSMKMLTLLPQQLGATFAFRMCGLDEPALSARERISIRSLRPLWIMWLMVSLSLSKLFAQGQVPGYEPGGWAYFGTSSTPGTCDGGHPVFYSIRIVSL